MNVVLFAAEGLEAQVLRETLHLHERVDGPWVIHQGQVGRYTAMLLETGVGKVAAAAAVAYARQRFNPRQGLWVGVAGALNPELKPLDLIVAQDAVQYDVDITAFGRAPGELASGERFVSADAVLTARVLRIAVGLGLVVRPGRIATADRFLADPAEAARIREMFAADAVDMEGAAALWSAKRMGLPLALIRAITDSAGSQAPADFSAFLQIASEHLAALVTKVLEG